MHVDVDSAMGYVHTLFNLNPDAYRMTENLFEYVSGHDVPDPEGLLLHVLDAFGFESRDLDGMLAAGCIRYDAGRKEGGLE